MPGRLPACDCPVLQVIFAGSDAASWRDGTQGLPARDIAMNVALPEVDGRILSRAVSFKGVARRDPLTETDIVAYEPDADRIAFVAELAANWVRLRRTPAAERRIALVLANYPNRDGRIGNGVGLDTPASAIAVLRALATAGYRVADIPEDGNALVARLIAGPTNDIGALAARRIDETFARSDYSWFFASLPAAAQERISGRWGTPERDPFFLPGELDCGRFAVSAFRCGNVAVVPAAGARLQHRSSRQLSRSGPAAAARLPRLLRLDARTLPRPRRRSTSASTAIWSGCRARRWRCRPTACRRRRWDRCRISIRSSSTIRAKARRPSAGRRR